MLEYERAHNATEEEAIQHVAKSGMYANLEGSPAWLRDKLKYLQVNCTP